MIISSDYFTYKIFYCGISRTTIVWHFNELIYVSEFVGQKNILTPLIPPPNCSARARVYSFSSILYIRKKSVQWRRKHLSLVGQDNIFSNPPTLESLTLKVGFTLFFTILHKPVLMTVPLFTPPVRPPTHPFLSLGQSSRNIAVASVSDPSTRKRAQDVFRPVPIHNNILSINFIFFFLFLHF